jgi:preprotein translocase subunit YajC
VPAYTGTSFVPVLAQEGTPVPGSQSASGNGSSDGQEAGQPGAQRAQSGPGMMTNLVVFGGIFLIFWLFIIRPQSKQRKEHEKLVSSLKKGDDVITNSGMFGRIAGFDDEKNAVILEIANNVKIRVVRANIGAIQGSGKESVAAQS